MFRPVLVGSANVSGQGGEEDAETGTGTVLHPSHTSNSQFLWKTGDLTALQKQQQPEQCCQGSLGSARTVPGKSPSMDCAETEKRSSGALLCSRETAAKSTAFLPNHGQRHIPSSDRIHPSKSPYGKAPAGLAVGNTNSCPTKGNICTMPQR